MGVLETILIILLLVAGVVVVAAVLLQQGKAHGLSGAIAGGTNENYFGKNGAPEKGKLLSKVTTIVAIVFVVIVVVAYLFT